MGRSGGRGRRVNRWRRRGPPRYKIPGSPALPYKRESTPLPFRSESGVELASPPHDPPPSNEAAEPPDKDPPEQIQAPADERGRSLPAGEASQSAMWQNGQSPARTLEGNTSIKEAHGRALLTSLSLKRQAPLCWSKKPSCPRISGAEACPRRGCRHAP